MWHFCLFNLKEHLREQHIMLLELMLTMRTASIRIHVGRISLGAPLAEKYPLRRKPEGIILLIIGKPALGVLSHHFFGKLLKNICMIASIPFVLPK